MKINGISQNQLNMPADMPAQNMRPIEQGAVSPAKEGVKGLSNNAANNLDSLKQFYSEKDLKKLGIIECQTCANRKYVDGSDDPGVSFKSPAQLDPSEAASAVMAHEMEHVSNEQANARAEGSEVVSQSVTIHTSICPECGISYVAGGVTNTVTKKKSDYGLSNEMTKGLNFDQII